MNTSATPIFLLPIVLFPGGHLPLRIFEQRYIDMVRDCSANRRPFGVCLANPAQEPGKRASHMRTGTLAEITDWSTLEDGLLGITACGRQKFIIQSSRMRDNGLMVADVSVLEEPGTVNVPEEYAVLSMIVARFMEQLGKSYPDFIPSDLEDADWLGYRLAELMPFDVQEKQVLLQLDNSIERLQLILEELPRFQQEQ